MTPRESEDDVAPEVTASQLARAGVHLDAQSAARARRHERRRWNTRVYPVIRIAGFGLLGLLVLLHGLLVREPASWAIVALFVAGSEAYALLSWAIVRRWFGREPWKTPDLSDILFAVDLPFWMGAVYLTGAEASWLFFVPLMRAADQAHGGVRRTLVYAHMGVLAYAGMLAWVVAVDGRTPAVGPEAFKLLLLWIGGFYIAMSAAPAERRRRQMGLAIRFARGMIGRVEARARDLAEQTRQAHALQQEAEASARGRARILSGVSHEFRTPLNHIMGFAQLLEMEELSDAQREAVLGISAGGRRLLRLVDRILEITGGDRDAEQGEREPLAVRPVLDTALSQLRPWLEDKDLTVDASGLGFGGDAPWVLAWPRRLEQVLWNVLSSVVHHAPRGGSIAIRTTRADGRVRIAMTDPDTFLPAAQLQRLFEPLEGMTASTPSERGLELAVAQALAGTVGGTVDVQSARAAGTTIVIELDEAAFPGRGGEVVAPAAAG